MPQTARSARIAPFITKTFSLVEEPETAEVVSWMDSGESFVVKNQFIFQMEILPRFFRHNNLSSFIRQLNTYGFKKVPNESFDFEVDVEWLIFAHPHFLRGRTDLHSLITRQRSGKRSFTEEDAPETTTQETSETLLDSLFPENRAGTNIKQEETVTQSYGTLSVANQGRLQVHEDQTETRMSEEDSGSRNPPPSLPTTLSRTAPQKEDYFCFLTPQEAPEHLPDTKRQRTQPPEPQDYPPW
jgi:hypothetical protein